MVVITITQDKPLQWSLQNKAKPCLLKDLQQRRLQGNIQAVPEIKANANPIILIGKALWWLNIPGV